MMGKQLISVLVLGASMILGTQAASEDEDHASSCRLWLAPSSLSSEQKAVFGLYAGSQGFGEDEIIPDFEIAIPVFDFLKSPAALKSNRNKVIVEYLETQMWIADYAGSKFESNNSVSAFVPGAALLSKYHAGFSNVDWLQGSLLLREPDELEHELTGKAHPSRGAITPYYNATMRALRTIHPGMELFVSYGETLDEDAVDMYHDKVSRWDYENADRVVDRVMEFMATTGVEMSDALKDDVLDFMLETVLEGAAGKHAKVIRSLIPAHQGKLQRVKDAGGTFLYRNKEVVKSLDWLSAHGLCVDNMRSGRSTIEDAGRGAFARHSMKQGSIISPIPMIPILNKEVLQFYTETIEENGAYVLDDSKPPTGHHLLVNYCFGHPESTLLLLPMAPMVNLINHAPEESKINAYLQWSQHPDVFNDHELHDSRIADWSRTGLPPIVMELVATRDIEEGEEIMIDYGPDWARAWREYKEAWVAKTYGEGDAPENAKWPLKAMDLRQWYKNKPYPFKIEHGQTPYPPGVITGCFIESADDLPDGEPRKNAAGQKILHWLAPATFEEYAGQNLAVCDLIDRYETVEEDGNVSYFYSVITRVSEKKKEKLREVRGVPHAAITLIDGPYTSDIHLPGAFRHWINVEDNRFPQAWRNIRNRQIQIAE
jgi:hypothetical protein